MSDYDTQQRIRERREKLANRHKGPQGHGDIDAEMQNMFDESADAIAEAEKRGEKPIKLFGLIEVPAGFSAFGKIAYNSLSNVGADYLRDPVYDHTRTLFETHLPKWTGHEFSHGAVAKTAAAASFATTFGLKAGMYVLPFFTTAYEHQKDNNTLAQKARPVLDELKGNHSSLAFMMVGMSDNTVITAHKRRMEKVYGSKTLAQVSDLVINAGANIMLDVKQFRGMWKENLSPKQLEAKALLKAEEVAVQTKEDGETAEHATQQSVLEQQQKGKNKKALDQGLGVAGALVSEIFTNQAHRKQKELEKHPSAFEMIVALEEQVSHNPNARFQAPKESRDYSLEAYIMKVILTHQRELADMDSHYSELRPALREDLAELVQPMAAAIRDGRISALTLMHLVGEPQKYPIIRNKGRALATGDEVEDMIEKMVGKKSNTRLVDVDDFMARHDMSVEHFKKLLPHATGEDRIKLCALIPNAVLEKVGVSEAEIHKIEEFRKSPEYDAFIRDLTAGLAATEEKDLKHTGMTNTQIKHLDRAAEKLREDSAAVKEIKTSLTNQDGIEHELLDWALRGLDTKKTLPLNTVAARGAELLNAKDAELPQRSFQDRLKDERGDAHAALEELGDEFDTKKGEGHHASRQSQRRAHDDDEYERYA